MAHMRALAQQVAIPGLVEHYMSRIWQLDGEVNAVVESCAPASSETPSADHEGIPRILEGLPFLVKDVVDVRNFHTVCGSPEYAGNPPAADDNRFVGLLRQLGAVPVGKTNVPYHSYDVQTFNEVYGLTRNPHNPELSPGGSSGGSAAAVALAMAAFALGSDWNGSLRIPAAFCGVSSLRASRGRMTLDGGDRLLPTMPSDPHLIGSIMVAGIIAKTVADLEFVMNALFPFLPCKRPEDGSTFASSTESSSIMIGVWMSFPGVPLDERIRGAMEAIPHRLEATAGADDGGPRMTACLTPGPPLHIARLYKALQVFTQGWDFVRKPMTSKSKELLDDANNVQKNEGDIIDSFLAQEGFAALVTPVCAVLPHEHNLEHLPFHINGEEVPYWKALTGYVAPFSVTGNPVVTLPLCVIDGRPLGIQVVGRRQCDEELLRVCILLERQLGPILNLGPPNA